MIRWVADTGPVLHLAEAKAIDLLPLLGEVVLPPAVHEELSRLRSPVSLPMPLRVEPLNDRYEAKALDWCKAGLVDRGESHAIALAQQMRADILLTDDAAARLLATTLGLTARGSLGVVLWLAGQRRIGCAEATQHLESLFCTSLWVSARVVAEARAALEQISKS
jgi:predicted nucleic acid-binding protein